MYDRTRTVQAALPRLFLQLSIESDGIDAKANTKIVSYEEASKQTKQDHSSTAVVSEVISQCKEESAIVCGETTGRVESDDGESENERHGMISLKKWKEAVRKSKTAGCGSGSDEQIEYFS